MVKVPHHLNLKNYQVGYGKPPSQTQFKQGKSGNPTGRPQGSKNKLPKQLLRLQDILLNEAYRTVSIQDKSGALQLSVAQAAMRALALKAAQGHIGAQKLFLKSLNDIETERAQQQQAFFETAFLYKKQMSEQIKSRKLQGLTVHEDALLPHPDHIMTDVRTGKVTFIGPVDIQDKKVWDMLWEQKQACEEDLELFAEWEKTKKPSKNIESLIRQTLDMLEMVEQTIVIRWHRDVEDVVKDPARRHEAQWRIDNNIWPKAINDL